MKHKYQRFLDKIRKAKKNLEPGEKPDPVKTHLRNAFILPEMVGSVLEFPITTIQMQYIYKIMIFYVFYVS